MSLTKVHHKKSLYGVDFFWNDNAGCYINPEGRKVLLFPPAKRMTGWMVMVSNTRRVFVIQKRRAEHRAFNVAALIATGKRLRHNFVP